MANILVPGHVAREKAQKDIEQEKNEVAGMIDAQDKAQSPAGQAVAAVAQQPGVDQPPDHPAPVAAGQPQKPPDMLLWVRMRPDGQISFGMPPDVPTIAFMVAILQNKLYAMISRATAPQIPLNREQRRELANRLGKFNTPW